MKECWSVAMLKNLDIFSLEYSISWLVRWPSHDTYNISHPAHSFILLTYSVSCLSPNPHSFNTMTHDTETDQETKINIANKSVDYIYMLAVDHRLTIVVTQIYYWNESQDISFPIPVHDCNITFFFSFWAVQEYGYVCKCCFTLFFL